MFDISSNNSDLLSSLEFLLKVAGGLGAFYLFIAGLKRYAKDQAWKRHEFVAEKAKDFNSDPMVRNVMYMLDWGSRYIELFPGQPDYDKRYAKVTRTILKSALQPHRFKSRYSRVEVAIRDNFDCFLNYFEVFEQYIEAGLITPKELEPYLKYWVFNISDNLEPDVRNTLYHYIQEYGFKGTQQLFKHFGKNIIPKTAVETARVEEEEESDTSGLANERDEQEV